MEQKKHNEEFVCPSCSNVFPTYKSIVAHMKSAKHASYNCNDCDHVFLSEGGLTQHCKTKGHSHSGGISTLDTKKIADKLDTTLKELKKRSEESKSMRKRKKKMEKMRMQLEKQEEEMIKAVQAAQGVLLNIKEDTEKQRLLFEEEKARIASIQHMISNRIILNIGGERFTTTHVTLTKFSNSMLGTMFSGRHDVVTDSDGSVFIDRSSYSSKVLLLECSITIGCCPKLLECCTGMQLLYTALNA